MFALSLFILSISAATLGLQIVLIRALSIAHWYHFAYLVISTALLGFGASGTMIAVAQKFFLRHQKSSMWVFAAAMAFLTPVTFLLAQMLPFDQLQLVWDARQLIYLAAFYLLFFLPFFCAGACICIAFTTAAEKAHHLYFFNMVGSGLGVAVFVALMYGCRPEQLLLLASALTLLGAFILACRMSASFIIATIACGLVTFALFAPHGAIPLKINISENKSLVYYTSLPDSKTVTTGYSPLARLDIVRAPAIRYLPGLSIGYAGTIPDQALLVSDADGISTLNRFDHPDELRCYGYVTSALPYHLFSGPRVCIIGAGGGSDVAQALSLGAAEITAVEMNRQIIGLLKGRFSDMVSNIYNHPTVKAVVAEGRNFLQTTNDRFDIIQISLLDSFAAAAAGLYSLNESHLYTVEAIGKALDRLTPGGLLSITRPLKTPPRDTLKMVATIAQALRSRDVKTPGEHIIVIRSWATATVIASALPLQPPLIEMAREFCRQRRFDLVYLPGIQASEVNRFHLLDEPFYHNAVTSILGDRRQEFYKNYVYNIRPATDNRPYFFDFLKLRAIPHMIRSFAGKWLPYSEWSYFILIVTLIQAAIVSFLLILLPLFLAKPIKTIAAGKTSVCGYFLLLGFAYMFLEMAFIHKMTLLLGSAVLIDCRHCCCYRGPNTDSHLPFCL
ncbi:MAG: spermidine synthase [Planctomycetota bacterium]|jgi:spermidine synthase